MKKLLSAVFILSVALLISACSKEDQKTTKQKVVKTYNTAKTATVSAYDSTKPKVTAAYNTAKTATVSAYDTSKTKALAISSSIQDSASDTYDTNKVTFEKKKIQYEKIMNEKLKEMNNKISELKVVTSDKYKTSMEYLENSYDSFKQSLVGLKDAGTDKWNGAVSKTKNDYSDLIQKYDNVLNDMKVQK